MYLVIEMELKTFQQISLFQYELNSNGCCFFFHPQGYNNSKGVTLEASFTPDSQFVMIGKKDCSFCLVN